MEETTMKELYLATIAAVTLTAATAVADDYIPRAEIRLPETRYVPGETKTEFVDGKKYEIPQVRDLWAEIRDLKVAELNSLSGTQEECTRMSATETTLTCYKKTSDCVKWEDNYVERETLKGGTIRVRSGTKSCISWGPSYAYTAFASEYQSMTDIRREDGIFDDDNLSIGDTTLDFKTPSAASRAAQVLEELRYITIAMATDRSTAPIIQLHADADFKYGVAKASARMQQSQKIDVQRRARIKDCGRRFTEPKTIADCVSYEAESDSMSSTSGYNPEANPWATFLQQK